MGVGSVLLVVEIPSKLCAQNEKSIIKAAYIRNALNFAHWPKKTFPSQGSSFQLGIAGEAPELEASLRLAFDKLNHRIQNRKVHLIKLGTPQAFSDLITKSGSRSCNALFLPSSENENFAKWLKAAGSQPVLLMSDDPEFIDQGGTFSLSPKDNTPNRYVYAIHVKKLRARKIRFNAEFLRLRSAVKIISK